MPTITITTNVPSSRLATARSPATPNARPEAKLMKALSTAVAKATGKPEQYVLVNVLLDKPMMFAGTEEPCAYGQLGCIGVIGGAKNKQISKDIAEVLNQEIGVPADRFYLQFTNVEASDMGWNYTTFG